MEISIHEENLFYYYIFQSLINTLGGVIFGYSFWIVAKNWIKNNPIRKFLIITAIGIILIYTVTQTTVIATAFPPLRYFFLIIYYKFNYYLVELSVYMLLLYLFHTISI